MTEQDMDKIYEIIHKEWRNSGKVSATLSKEKSDIAPPNWYNNAIKKIAIENLKRFQEESDEAFLIRAEMDRIFDNFV